VITKAEAVYRPGGITDLKRCAFCSMFRLPDSCTLVQGTIDPFALCNRWQPVLIGRP
jgi:hypothetical protein